MGIEAGLRVSPLVVSPFGQTFFPRHPVVGGPHFSDSSQISNSYGATKKKGRGSNCDSARLEQKPASVVLFNFYKNVKAGVLVLEEKATVT